MGFSIKAVQMQVDVACRAFHQEVNEEVTSQDDDFSDDDGEVSPKEVSFYYSYYINYAAYLHKLKNLCLLGGSQHLHPLPSASAAQ